MKWLRASWMRLRSLFCKEQFDRELTEELANHVEMHIEDNLRAGMTPEEARRNALLKLGGLEQTKESVRDQRTLPFLESLFQDLRFALRLLRKSPAFTATAVLTLALGIGATAAMFGVVYSLLFDPFPYQGADRLAVINIHDLKQNADSGSDREEFSIPEFLEYQQHNHVFEDLVGSYSAVVRLEDGGGTTTFGAAYVTGNTFDFYGVPPQMGRGIVPEDAAPGAPPVFVMNYKVWTADFAADSKILGKTYLIDGIRRTLVGIMPPRFQVGGGRLWLPLDLSSAAAASTPVDKLVRLWTVGRLKPGLSLAVAAADVQVLAKRLVQDYPKEYPEQFNVNVQNLVEALVGNFKVMLYVLLGAVAILLLIACSNVANLMLAKATTREREIGVRVSLGAGPIRLVRQLLAESLLLATLACLVGCFFAYFGLKGISATVPANTLPDEAVIGFNPVVLLFAVALSFSTTLLCGLAPAVHAVRGSLQERLSGSGKNVNTPSGHGPFRTALVIAEVALSVVLLTGAGLLTRSFVALTSIDLGFNPKDILFAQLSAPPERKDTIEDQKLFFDQALPRVKALPGVVSATAAYSLPPVSGTYSDVTVPGKTHSEPRYTRLELCSAGFFETMQLHLLRGRVLSESDIASSRRVIVVNETLARRFFPSEDPIGQEVKFDWFDKLAGAPHDAYFEIIGVVRDFSNWDVRKSAPLPEAILPYTILARDRRIILARTSLPPDSLLPAVRREIWAVDPKIAIDTGNLQDFLAEDSYSEPRFNLITSGAFAGIALLLVVMGVFSVMAYSVSLRTHEIGVRMALGATQDSILKMVLAKGFRLIAAGLVIGLLVSFAQTRFIANQIWGVSVTDPLTFFSVVVLVALVGFTACILPAHCATKVDPVIALRYE